MIGNLRGAIATIVLLLAFASDAGAAVAQTLTGPAPSASTTPYGVRQEGQFLTAPLQLDGQNVFRLASAPLQTNQPSVVARIIEAETALAAVVMTDDVHGRTTTAYDPASLRIIVEHAGAQEILSAKDARHDDPLQLLTVTTTDAKYNQTTVDTLATSWQGLLSDALHAALLRREPAVQEARLRLVGVRAAMLAGITLLVVLVIVLLQRRISTLRARLAAVNESAREANADASAKAGTGEPAAESAARRRGFLRGLLRSTDLDRRIAILSFLSTVAVFGIVVTWFLSTAWALSLFAATATVAATVARVTTEIVVTWLVAILLDRLIGIVIAEIGTVWRTRSGLTSDENARSLLRIPTITGAISGFKSFLIYFFAILITLGQAGVPVASVVTVGGIVAVGISLGAQNFLRDFIAGFLVLFEDQYVVGDHVTMNGNSGIVEMLSLRMVQIRNIEGALVTISHSSVTSVVNSSRNWSRISYRVSLAPSADPTAGLATLRAAFESFAADARYASDVLEAVEWAGVDSYTSEATLLRASMRTSPLRQFELRRALNGHVRAALLDAGFALGPGIDPGHLASG